MIEESKNGFFNEAIVIGLLTAFCYIAGYLYETGYKGYYHLPDTFVEIGLTTIVKSTWKIIKALVTTLLVVNLISYSSTKELKFASSGLDYLNYILMFCFFYNVTSKITTYTPIAFILIFIIANYLIPIFKFRNIKGINNRIQKSKQEKEGSVSILQAVRNKYGLKAVIVIIFCSTIMGNMYLIQQKGMQDAQYEKEYLVTNTPTPMIIIDTYKDYFIIAPVDLATKTITPKFKLLKQSKDMPDLPEFEWKKIGPLKVSD